MAQTGFDNCHRVEAFTAATPVKKLCSEGSTICMSSLLSGVTEVASEAEDDNQQPPRTARGGGGQYGYGCFVTPIPFMTTP
eukprot:4262654-Amphidinium_carterae.1